MRDAIILEGAAQRVGDVILAYNIIESRGAIGAIQGLGHPATLCVTADISHQVGESSRQGTRNLGIGRALVRISTRRSRALPEPFNEPAPQYLVHTRTPCSTR